MQASNSSLRIFLIRKELLIALTTSVLILLTGCNQRTNTKSDEKLMKLAQKICVRNIILDSHIDWPEWLLFNHKDISEKTSEGDFDLVRAKEGGMDAVLSVVYIDPAYSVDSGRIMVDSMLNMIRAYPGKYPDKFAMAFTPEDVRNNASRDLFSLIPCLENGSPAGDDPEYPEYLKKQGIAYITLCHSKRNQFSDSSFDPDRQWNGLSPAGRELIKNMNRLGIMIDVSHTTDSTVAQALRLSEAPIIASHSSCRYFVPGLERDLPDDLIKGIADKGGVVMVNFAAMFLDSVCKKNTNILLDSLDLLKIDYSSPEGAAFIDMFGKTHKLFTDYKRLVDHIEHIINIAGIDYVGLGSDFDGIGPSKPLGVTDVSDYPVIVTELLRRGYSEKDINKILSDNFLRVWDEVLKAADYLGPGGQ